MKRALLKLFDPLYRWITAYLAATGLLLYGGKGDVPPAPDYAGAAATDAAASQQLATQQNYANRPTQNTPWGSTFWTQGQQTDPATGQPVTSWTQNQTLDPALQQTLNEQLAMQSGRTQLAGSFMGRVADEYSQPFDWTNLPGTAGTPQQQFTYGRDAQSYLPSYNLNTQFNNPLTSGQERVNPTTSAMQAPEFAAERQRIEQGLFQRMQPEHDRQSEMLRTQLANQGFTPGSEGYEAERQRLGDQQARERFNALEMGGAEQARMQQMMLGQQGQAFGQQLGAGQFGLGAQAQAFGQRGTAQEAYNRALQQQQAMQAASGQFYNTAQQQMYGQDLGANAQNWQQMLGGAEYQNRLRQQALAEQAMQRGMSLNELNALTTGQQVSAPSMPSFASAQAGQAPNYLQAAGLQGQAGLDQYNASQQGDQAMMSGLFKMGAATAPYWAPLLFGSDVRLKSNIERVGTHALGIGIYEYDIEDRRERGVMAHEVAAVRPDLVYLHPRGHLMVDYAGLERQWQTKH